MFLLPRLTQDSNAVIANLTPPDFVTKSFPRLHRRGGCIAVIYRSNLELKISLVGDISNFKHSSFELMELSVDFGTKYFNFVCLYRAPYPKANKSSFTEFSREFQEIISTLNLKKGTPVILGDFNIHYESNTCPEAKKIKSIITAANMTQLIALPTHNKNHILDWIITKDCDIDTLKNTQVVKKLVSDHHLTLFELDAEKPPKVKRKITSRNLKTINIEKFKSDVKIELQTIDSINIENLNDALSRI
ncbi:ATP-dependent DNA helicase [Elysia marginata]|uniref:ATP-dependent DNA helicase n=1 Tax=Elysia marginata TaxID=1093978 RepID=A0AAV4GBB5_9GAST|nr:ATP-dependent DNA helicase [Elysia marginata]